jgi:hypothetical protein
MVYNLVQVGWACRGYETSLVVKHCTCCVTHGDVHGHHVSRRLIRVISHLISHLLPARIMCVLLQVGRA